MSTSANGGGEVQLTFDLDQRTKRRWTGPHTALADCMAQVGNYFITSHRSYGAALFVAQLVGNASSVYTDNGVPITFLLESSTFPKDGQMSEKMVMTPETQLDVMALQVKH